MNKLLVFMALGVLSAVVVGVGLRFGVDSYAGDRVLAQQGEPTQGGAPPVVAPSDDQNAMLADGLVTEEEVRAALTRAADCLELRGVQPVRVGHPQLEGNLELMVYVPDGGDFAKSSAAVRECSAQHSALVTSTYRSQTRGANPSNPVLGPDGRPTGSPAKPR